MRVKGKGQKTVQNNRDCATRKPVVCMDPGHIPMSWAAPPPSGTGSTHLVSPSPPDKHPLVEEPNGQKGRRQSEGMRCDSAEGCLADRESDSTRTPCKGQARLRRTGKIWRAAAGGDLPRNAWLTGAQAPGEEKIFLTSDQVALCGNEKVYTSHCPPPHSTHA